MVLHASIGIKKILKEAAAAEANKVFTGVGKFTYSKPANIPVLAAVSPNLEIGPYKRAGPTPL